jgi:hypothetical protein
MYTVTIDPRTHTITNVHACIDDGEAGVCVCAQQRAERACLPHSDYVERRIVHPLAQHMLTNYLQTHQLMNAVEHGCAQRMAASTANNKRASVGHTRTCAIGGDVSGLSEVVIECARVRVHISVACIHTHMHGRRNCAWR